MAEGAAKTESWRPNREKPESKQTKAIIVFLLVVSAALIAVVTIGGWDKLEGVKMIPPAYVLIYLVFAYYTSRWNRGVLPVVSALATILIIFAAIAGPAWFDRDKTGFDDPTLPPSLLGLLTLLIIPVQALLIAVAMRGFRQQWNIEGGSRAAMEAGYSAPSSPAPETRT